MPHHHSHSEPEPEWQSTSRLLDSQKPVEAQWDAQIEDFLDRVFARLVAVLPYDERQARRDVMRAQIEQSIAAHVEIGSSRHEAIALSLAQVQRENAIATQALPQARRTLTRTQPSAKPATIAALGIFGLFYLLDQTRIAGHLWNLLFGGMYDEAGEVLRNSVSVTNFYRFELFVLPLICGLAVGLLAKRRPVRGTLNALALLAIPAIGWGGIVYGLTYAGLMPMQTPEWLKFIFPNPLPAMAGIAVWSALGALSAGAGHVIRRRLPKVANAAKALGRHGRRLLRSPRRTSRHNRFVDTPL